MNIDLFKELETERLILRRITTEDAKNLYDNVFSNFEYYKYYYQKPFNSFEEYVEVVKQIQLWYENKNHFRWGIVLKDTNEMIGQVFIHTKDVLNNNCKIGYIIGYAYQNKGYMQEATEKVIDFIFNDIGYKRIEANIVCENDKSIKLVKSLNMVEEGIKEQAYLLKGKYYNQYVYSLINDGI